MSSAFHIVPTTSILIFAGVLGCVTNPCMNGGVCIEDLNNYKCICDVGYTGYNCETSM